MPTLEQDEARVRDPVVHLLGQRNGCDAVGAAVQDESRLVDLPSCFEQSNRLVASNCAFSA